MGKKATTRTWYIESSPIFLTLISIADIRYPGTSHEDASLFSTIQHRQEVR